MPSLSFDRRLRFTSTIQRLMSSHVIDDLTSSILDFQANEVRIILRRKHEPVDPLENVDHFNTLRYIWQSSKLEEDVDSLSGERRKWVKIGFASEDVTQEFETVGVLGLDCLVSSFMWLILNAILTTAKKNYIQSDPDSFAKVCRMIAIEVPFLTSFQGRARATEQTC